MITGRDPGTPAATGPTLAPTLPPVPARSASDAEWAAFRAAGRARRRATALAVRARALSGSPPELRRWDGTPYPDLTADPLFEPWPAAGEAPDPTPDRADGTAATGGYGPGPAGPLPHAEDAP